MGMGAATTLTHLPLRSLLPSSHPAAFWPFAHSGTPGQTYDARRRCPEVSPMRFSARPLPLLQTWLCGLLCGRHLAMAVGILCRRFHAHVAVTTSQMVGCLWPPNNGSLATMVC
jgi:hypothetical protein